MAEGLIGVAARSPWAGAVVVEVRGEIDMLTAPRLESAVCGQLARRPRLVVLDLGRVSFMGASGLAVLLSVHDLLPRIGVSLRLAGPSPAVVRPLTALRLAGVFDIHDDVTAALSGVTARPGGGR